MKLLKLVLLLANCTMLAACASGPKFSDASSGIPPIPAGEGRVYFYRTQVFGTAVQPAIYLGDQQASRCSPRGVSVADVPPGNYEATVSTEVEHKLTFTVDAGEEKFVRCYITLGLLIGHGNIELINPKQGHDEIQGLAFTGQTSVTAKAPSAVSTAAPAQSSAQ